MIPWIYLGAAAFATLLHLTIRDAWFAFATFYYAFPISICALMTLFAAVTWRRNKSRWLMPVSLVYGSFLFVWFVASAFESHAQCKSPDSIRVLFWNVWKGHMGWDSIADVIASKHADIIILVEITPKTSEMKEFWTRRFPEHHVVDIDRSMMALSRFRISSDEIDSLEGMGNVRIYQLDGPYGEFDLIHADLKSKPLRSRRPAFDSLAEIIGSREKKPSLLMGDFNTPSDSVFFDPIRKSYSNVFEQTGHGFNVTWPNPFPVLSLDQIWASPQWELLACDIQSSFRSDHRMLIADMKLK